MLSFVFFARIAACLAAALVVAAAARVSAAAAAADVPRSCGLWRGDLLECSFEGGS